MMTGKEWGKVRQTICGYIDAHKDEMVELLCELVRIPSIAVSEEQEKCQLLLEEKLKAAGASVDRWIPDWEAVKRITYPNTGDSIYQTVEEQNPEYLDIRQKVSVLAGTFEGAAPGKTLVFNGHIDVAGLGERKDWNYDPWGQLEGDRIYGRGTADQKGGVIAALYAIFAIQECFPQYHGKIHLVVTPEEETGGNGTAASIQRGYTGDAAIFTDISDNQVIISNSGIQKFRIEIQGNPADMWHENSGDAAEIMMQILHRIREFEKSRNQNARKKYGFSDEEKPASINVGFVRAGEWIASAPGTASIEGLMAVLPEDDLIELRKEFESIVTGAGGSEWFLAHPPKVIFYPGKEGCLTDSEEEIVKAAITAVSEMRGKEEAPQYGNLCSDMTYYPILLGIPSILFGPGKVLHCPDEYLDIPDLLEAAKVMALTAVIYLETL